MYMAAMMTWEFVLSRSNPVDLGACLHELAHDEISPDEPQAMNPLYGELWARWLRSKALMLDTEEWDQCTGGLLAHCEAVRLEGWDEALDLLVPRDKQYQEARDELLAELDESDYPIQDEEDDL